MYKVLKDGSGWSVYRMASPDTSLILIPHLDKNGRQVPYPQRQAAYRRCKQLNDAVRQIDEVVARDSAIIL